MAKRRPNFNLIQINMDDKKNSAHAFPKEYVY